jgi:hypothetical protein
MNFIKQQIQAQLKLLSNQTGLDIDTPFHWVINNANNPALFFENLPIIVQNNAVLYFECLDPVPEASYFYEKHQSKHQQLVARDSVFPIPTIYHVRFSREFVAGMTHLISKVPSESLFIHIKCYMDNQIVFTFHDAFSGFLRISNNIPKIDLTKFCNALKCGYTSEKTIPRDPRILDAILSALEKE